MKVLIVGAGAVGQIYAYYLLKSGAGVSFFIKEKYRQELSKPQKLFQYGLFKSCTERALNFTAENEAGSYRLESDAEQLNDEYDFVIVTVSSTALRSGWLAPLLAKVPSATIVSCQPGMKDKEYFLALIPETRLLGMVTAFMSYQSPLGGEPANREGISYYLPPGHQCMLDKGHKDAQALGSALKQGGFVTQYVADVHVALSQLAGLMTPLIAGLEMSDWSFDKLRKSPDLNKIFQSIHEVSEAVSVAYDVKPLFALKLLGPKVVRYGLPLVKKVFPFDAEVYLRYHYEKVSDQSLLMMQMYLEEAERVDVPTPALKDVFAALS